MRIKGKVKPGLSQPKVGLRFYEKGVHRLCFYSCSGVLPRQQLNVLAHGIQGAQQMTHGTVITCTRASIMHCKSMNPSSLYKVFYLYLQGENSD